MLATFFGLRITPVDIDESRAYRLRDLAFDIQEERATMRRWMRSTWISEEEREAALAESATRIREIVAQAIEIRDGARPDIRANASVTDERPARRTQSNPITPRFILRGPPPRRVLRNSGTSDGVAQPAERSPDRAATSGLIAP